MRSLHRGVFAPHWMLMALVCCAAALLSVWRADASLHATSLALSDALLVTAVCGVLLVVTVRSCGIWSATGAYLIVFSTFHLGLVAALGLRLVEIDELSSWTRSWADGPYATAAVWLAAAAATSVAAGGFLFRALRQRAVPSGATNGLTVDHTRFGVLLICGSVASWFSVLATHGGLQLLRGSYENYLSQTEDMAAVLSGVWLVLGLGMVLLAAGPPVPSRKAAYAALAVFSCFGLPLGLRGEIMFPAVGALVAAARSGVRMPASRTCVLVAVGMLAIPVIREFRSLGWSDVSEFHLRLAPAETLVELGSSLNPVEKVVRWHEEGEPLALGATYWAPFERAAARVLPGLGRNSAEDDLRIMNVLVAERVGAIGFSPVAEAYRNFGALGIVPVSLLIGVVLGWIDTEKNRRSALLATAVVLVPLLVNIRNSFVTVPAQLLVGLVSVLMISALPHLRAIASGGGTPRRQPVRLAPSSPVIGFEAGSGGR